MITEPRLLVIGIGNNGRRDDGLGWAFADQLSADALSGIVIEWRYQLQVEDAWLLSAYEQVLFVDASQAQVPDGFSMSSGTSAPHYYFSSHHQSPDTLLYLAEKLYGKKPQAHILAIEGRDWGMGTGLSQQAGQNLCKALDFFRHTWWPQLAEQYQSLSGQVTL